MKLATTLRSFLVPAALSAGLFLLPATAAWSQDCCVVPDNGNGTALLPPVGPGGCLYLGTTEIVDGLPPASSIQVNATLGSFTLVTEVPGGALLGTASNWEGVLDMSMTGTGALLGFSRSIQIPVGVGGNGIIHWSPRTNFAPLQSATADLFQCFGQIFMDPDFDLLRVTAGTNYGMPSPGAVQLTSTGGGWAVSSFFDLSHRIDFVGAPGSPWLAGRSGSTTRLRRFTLCDYQPVPAEAATWSGIKALIAD